MKINTLLPIALLATAAAHAQTATYAIDPTHTWVTFEIGHMGTSTLRGRFDRKQGSVVFDRAAHTGKVDVTIDAGSISTGMEPFNKHLSSQDFFNVAEYPTIRFSADTLAFSGDRVAGVTGRLTLLGKSLPVTLTAKNFNCYDSPMLKREVCGGDFEATITRSQYGVNYGLNWGFPDNMKLVIQVEAIKQ